MPTTTKAGPVRTSSTLSFDRLRTTPDSHTTWTSSRGPDSTVLCTARFDPYGTPRSSALGKADPDTGETTSGGLCATGAPAANTRWWQGARRDTTTADYRFGDRTYRPGLATWTSPDVWRNGTSTQHAAQSADAAIANNYAYVNGDPINLTDPDGHRACDGPKAECPGYNDPALKHTLPVGSQKKSNDPTPISKTPARGTGLPSAAELKCVQHAADYTLAANLTLHEEVCGHTWYSFSAPSGPVNAEDASNAVEVLVAVAVGAATGFAIGYCLASDCTPTVSFKGVKFRGLTAKNISALQKLGKPSAAENLTGQLAAAGIKHNAADIVRIGRDGTGRIVFLETGNSRAGLTHIIEAHADDFARRGVTVDQIPDLVQSAATRGRIVGYQGSGTGRPIYEVSFNGRQQRVAVTVGDNGFIVGANPS